jgi:hypothetical protein
VRDAEKAYEELRQRRGEGMFTPLRDMLLPEWKDRFAPDYDVCASPSCPVEGKTIEPGDTVFYDGTGRQVHEDCEAPGG